MLSLSLLFFPLFRVATPVLFRCRCTMFACINIVLESKAKTTTTTRKKMTYCNKGGNRILSLRIIYITHFRINNNNNSGQGKKRQQTNLVKDKFHEQ